MAVQHSVPSINAFAARTVIFKNDPETVDFLGGGRGYASGYVDPIDGPTSIHIRRKHSDAAIDAIAPRFGLDSVVARAFRDNSEFGQVCAIPASK